jgi:cytochrome c oxidase subunit 2
MELLILVAVLLVIIALAKVLKANELVNDQKDPNELPVSPSDIKTNATAWLTFGIVFLSLVVISIVSWNKYLLPSAASEHGVEYDTLMVVTMALILTVFFITHVLLFWFAFKYYYRPGQKAFWYPHNNRLEMAWTFVPAVVLIALISYGMMTWSDIMNAEEEEDNVTLEFVSEQFKWTARYAGDDNKLGAASFRLYGKNPVGIATKESLEGLKADLEGAGEKEGTIAMLMKDSAAYQAKVDNGWNRDKKLADLTQSLKNFRSSLNGVKMMLNEYEKNPVPFDYGNDDKIINSDSIILPKGRQVVLKLRSKDVIHSAYLPHFRAQMNTVPGMETQFIFKPTLTNEEMAAKAEEEGKNFTGYVLLCNKICGASHFNMKLKISVVEPEVYEKWIAEQTEFAETL